jgi:hypothetical protein
VELLKRIIPLLLRFFLGVSTLGLFFVIYFYKKLTTSKVEEVGCERVAKVVDLHGVEFGAYSELK